MPIYAGRLTIGTVYAMMTIQPEKRPEEPSPAMARPTIKAFEVGAAPHTAEPTSKMSIEVRKTHLME